VIEALDILEHLEHSGRVIPRHKWVEKFVDAAEDAALDRLF
jgi:hypothetical protein